MEQSSAENTSEDPIEEVKKLQELVRRLEQQNQQLRNRQKDSDKEENDISKGCKNDTNNHSVNQGHRTPLKSMDSRLNPNGLNVESEDSRTNDSRSVGAEKRESFRKSGVLDDVDLINIEDLDISDEDSWLYTSPKGLSTEERSVSPYKWLRKDVEDPQNKELQLAKRALAYKLDESAICRVIDSRTFTRGKKKRSTFEEGGESHPRIETLRDEDEDEDEDAEPSSYMSSIKPTDVIDVQGIARMQEESLRQSSPSTPKRISLSSISGRRWSNSSKNSMSDSEEAFPSMHTVDGITSGPHQATVTVSAKDQSEACTNSPHSSPPESLHGSNSSLENGTDSFRHSLPNLAKGYNGARTFQRQQLGNLQVEINCSPPRITGSGNKLCSAVRSSAMQGERRLGLASRSASNLRSPSTVHRVQRQVVNGSPSPPYLTPQALSPTSNRHPPVGGTPKSSGLPRLSRIPGPRTRSGIPGPSRGPSEDNSADNELWSDGCY